ncbi:MAG TPA: urease accessory protein UreF [Candidatus Acidoferrum sp.]|nr:urease accessory protein UreF [Candidatus Acidoferrum sp.]
MRTDRFLSLLHFSDGLFPAGAYAHSFGLETFVQESRVYDAAGVDKFLREFLSGSSAPTDAVLVLCAQRAANEKNLPACFALDARLDAMKSAVELREASRQMGRQTLRIARELMPQSLAAEFFAVIERDETPGHHAVAFGVVGSSLDWQPRETAAAFLYATSSALVGAALRLIPLGQLAGQRILWNLQPLLDLLAESTLGKTEADIWNFAPALEIAAMRHANLDARLFRS